MQERDPLSRAAYRLYALARRMFPGSTLARLKLALAAAKRGNSEGAQRLLAPGTAGGEVAGGGGGRGLEHEMAAMMMMDGGYTLTHSLTHTRRYSLPHLKQAWHELENVLVHI